MGVTMTTKTVLMIGKRPLIGVRTERVQTRRFTNSPCSRIFCPIIHSTQTNRRMYEQLVHN